MAKKIDGYINLQVPAGQANPSPPIGPALGQRGLNIMEFCKQFNAKSKDMEAGAPIPVKITLSPDVLVAADSVLHHKPYSILSGDTVIVSADLNVLVQHVATPNSGVEAVLVRYTIDQAPPSNGQGPTVVLYSENVPSSRDTTDGSGRAARRARLRLAALSTVTEDTVRISAMSSYRGQSIGAVQFTIIYTKQ